MSAFHTDGPLAIGPARLSESVAHHVRVKRLDVGATVRLTDGAGRVGDGRITRIGRAAVEVEVERVDAVAPPPPIDLFAPVGDRERMLWLAEKATELGIRSWRPVVFRRSRSVSPRGEGPAFAARVRARMIAALEQSGGAWLPTMGEAISVERAAAIDTEATRYLLDPAGGRFLPSGASGGTAIILGPEGGIEPDERDMLLHRGWRPVALAATILRFETAGIAAVAIARASHMPPPQDRHG